jgi:hypothetical protein
MATKIEPLVLEAPLRAALRITDRKDAPGSAYIALDGNDVSSWRFLSRAETEALHSKLGEILASQDKAA